VLANARSLLSRTDEETSGLWPRAVALLGRQSLEIGIGETLARRASGTERTSARAQLLCLPTFAPTDAAHEASYVWFALTRVCHHHPYELAPTADELEDWLEEVEKVLVRIAVPSAAPAHDLSDD
jgi:hypothetical protein